MKMLRNIGIAVFVIAFIGFKIHKGTKTYQIYQGSASVESGQAQIIHVDLLKDGTVFIDAVSKDSHFTCYWLNEADHNSLQNRTGEVSGDVLYAISTNEVVGYADRLTAREVPITRGMKYFYFEGAEDKKMTIDLNLKFK